MDRLASEGVLFERALSHSPQTLPAHASILGGRLPYRHGVRDNIGFSVGPGERLLPSRLRGARLPLGRVRIGLRAAPGDRDRRRLRPLRRGVAAGEPEASMGSVRRDGAGHGRGARATGSRRRPTAASCCSCTSTSRTGPWRVPDAFRRPATTARCRTRTRSSAGCSTRLRERGFYDPALVVLLSDHGEGLGDHGEEEHGVFLYDEGHAGPAHRQAARRPARREPREGAGAARRRPPDAARAGRCRAGDGAGRPVAPAAARRPAGRPG